MKLLARCVAGLTLLGTLAACGGEDAVMPDVTAKRLDVALSDLERAGHGDQPEVIGGGMFGVVDESNWTVCDQVPAPGKTVTSTPRLTVDRECEAPEESDGEKKVAEETSEKTSSAPKAAKRQPTRRARAARASETFVMPFLVGSNLQDAQDRLQSMGSYLLTQNDATGMERFQVLDSGWKVCAQFPAAGMRVSIARMVDLRVVKLHESCL